MYRAANLAVSTSTSAAQTLAGVKSCAISLDDSSVSFTVRVSDDGDAPQAGDPSTEVPGGGSFVFGFGPDGLGIGQTIQYDITASGAANAMIEVSS